MYASKPPTELEIQKHAIRIFFSQDKIHPPKKMKNALMKYTKALLNVPKFPKIKLQSFIIIVSNIIHKLAAKNE